MGFVSFFSCCCYTLPQTWWLKTTHFIILQFCKSEVQHKSPGLNIKAGLLSFLQTMGHSMSLPFPPSRSCLHSLTHGPFFICKTSMLHLSDHTSVVTSPSDHSQESSLQFFFLPLSEACRILVPRPWIKLVPPAVEAQSSNHWTIREVPKFSAVKSYVVTLGWPQSSLIISPSQGP